MGLFSQLSLIWFKSRVAVCVQENLESTYFGATQPMGLFARHVVTFSSEAIPIAFERMCEKVLNVDVVAAALMTLALERNFFSDRRHSMALFAATSALLAQILGKRISADNLNSFEHLLLYRTLEKYILVSEERFGDDDVVILESQSTLREISENLSLWFFREKLYYSVRFQDVDEFFSHKDGFWK